MKKILSAAIICVLTLAIAQQGFTFEFRNSPPFGFIWQNFKEIKGLGLRPKGWCFKKSVSKDKIVYRITKNRPKDNCFFTGLTINTMKDVTHQTSFSADLYGAYYIYQYMDDSLSVFDKWSRTEGPFSYYGCEVLKKIKRVDESTLFRVRVSAIANTQTDTLYICIFGSPVSEWKQASRIEEVLMNNIKLSESF